jgi:hypothetical protein
MLPDLCNAVRYQVRVYWSISVLFVGALRIKSYLLGLYLIRY